MRNFRSYSFRARARRMALFAVAVAMPGPLLAQYIGAAPPPPAAPIAGMVETPSAALARNLRLIALNPRDFAALVAAGRAALDLGDYQAAVGFFGRAEEVRPADPAPKIGMGAATAEMGDARGALAWLAQAQQLGATRAQLGADRGLAQDLLGNQAAAQGDYEAALVGPDRDEARRRLALSLAISRDPGRAIVTLQPLLNRRDPAAQRVRAFILALGGDRDGARRAIESAMPGSSARIDPFFAILPTLSVEQKAAAVHLGVFPTPSEMKLAAVEPLRAPPQASVRPAPQRAAERASSRPPKKQKVAVGRRVALPATPLEPPPPIVRPTPSPTRSPIIAPAPPAIVLPSPPPPRAVAATTMPERATSDLLPGDRLSGIDKLLARTSEASPPPAPRPRVERPLVAASSTRAAETKKAAAKKAANLKQAAAEKKAAAEDKKQREAIGVAGTNWVQIAGGSHGERMAAEYKKRAAKSAALRKRGGFVTQGKDYFRLLTGPFDSKSEAQSFTNALAKDGVDGFSWTRTPATIKIEKLPSK